MWTLSEGICMLIMLIIAIQDIRERKVSSGILSIGALGSVLYQFISKEMDMVLIIGGVLIGGCFLLLSKLTEEGIGYGDSYTILVLGSYLGFWNLLIVLSMAFFLLLCVSVPVLWKKKMSRTYTLPFLPFLTGGYMCLLLAGGVNR